MDVYVPVNEFNEALWKRFKAGKIRNVYPLTKYHDIIEKIKTVEENPPCNTPGEYYLLRKFIVVNVEGRERLSTRSENSVLTDHVQGGSASKIKFYVALEEIYKYIDEVHKSIKHGGRDRIVRNIQNKGIVNITRDTVELFLSYCKICRPRKRDFPRRPGSKCVNPQAVHNNNTCDSPINSINNESDNSERLTIITNSIVGKNIDLNESGSFGTLCSFTRGYIDLINYSTNPDGDFKFVFIYIDLQTCFSVLQPVRCKCSGEIVSHLLTVFSLLGPPQILHSSFDDQFLSVIVQEVKQAWPDIVLVYASERYQELQEVAENCISEINSLLNTWMSENNSNRWSHGLKFTQLRKNTKVVGNNEKSPYECFFGRPVDTSKLPSGIDTASLKNSQKEEDLLSIINQQCDSKLSPYESLQVSLDPNICSLVQNHLEGSPESISNHQIIDSSIVKIEPASDEEVSNVNGFSLSDSSNDICFSPKNGNLECGRQETFAPGDISSSDSPVSS
ncbi:KRAB-A domain-containing protein 2-like [Uloborus diversus]|uniref:KRAB-A domain-containing protein 2-like n=1 Tax=Uloborus diversus TaxID=327109 RepID=UPI0024091B12|nr:KRAB-A domain-containing protein 2-like [Uloborus diversus]